MGASSVVAWVRAALMAGAPAKDRVDVQYDGMTVNTANTAHLTGTVVTAPRRGPTPIWRQWSGGMASPVSTVLNVRTAR